MKHLYAGKHDPWLGVHSLAQFAFCERAGVISVESNETDTGEEVENAGEQVKQISDADRVVRSEADKPKQIVQSVSGIDPRRFRTVYKKTTLDRMLKTQEEAIEHREIKHYEHIAALKCQYEKKLARHEKLYPMKRDCFVVFHVFCILAALIAYFMYGGWWTLVLVPLLLIAWLTMDFLSPPAEPDYPQLTYPVSMIEVRDSLRKCLQLAEASVPEMPNPRKYDKQGVQWWNLLRAGFEAVPLGKDEILKHHGLRLAGRPWSVLRYQSLRIPVIRIKLTGDHKLQVDSHTFGSTLRKTSGALQYPGADITLYRQHFARIAAYCLLLESSEKGIDSPYGIILFGDTYSGVAISSHSNGTIKALQVSLATARETLAIKSAGGVVPRPTGNKKCSGCPHGFCVVLRPGKTENKLGATVLEPYTFLAQDDREYHSLCGDRFKWEPPHQKYKDKTDPYYY